MSSKKDNLFFYLKKINPLGLKNFDD